MDESAGIAWLERHLRATTRPLLSTPWILDLDATVKCLYGQQEGAVVGYNPKKSGRPSHYVVVLRRKLSGEMLLTGQDENQGRLAFIESDVPTARYEYAMLVTSTQHEILTLAQFYLSMASSPLSSPVASDTGAVGPDLILIITPISCPSRCAARTPRARRSENLRTQPCHKRKYPYLPQQNHAFRCNTTRR